MPTFLRSSSLSSFGSLTSCPSTVIEPLLIGFKALTHRISVDFPDPDGPIMQITSRFMTSNEIPFKTSRSPKDLCTSLIDTIGCDSSHAIDPSPQIFTAYLRSSLTVQRAMG